MNKLLNDFANWLWDMERLRVDNHLPPFETPEMIVEFYSNAKLLPLLNSGLSYEELEIEKLVDKIKLTETTLECIGLVNQFIKEKTNAIDLITEISLCDGYRACCGKELGKEAIKLYFDSMELQIPKSFEKT